MNTKSFKMGLQDGIPVALGYFAVSFTFGIASILGGLTTWQAVLISITNVTSAGQFAGLSIIAAGGSYLEIALTQLIINLRYSLMSFSLAQKLEPQVPWYHRCLMSYGVTDEIFGLSAAREGKISPFYNYGCMCIAIPGWVMGTLIGAVSGTILPDTILSALNVAIYGMFLAIIIPPARKNLTILAVVASAMILSGLFRVIPLLSEISSGFVIIIVTLLVSCVAALLRPIGDENQTKENIELEA
ncbi:MAG: AzlC family ABC transporter permease [Clostridium sp.]|nr:AzlC family ABC transporter permease [Clostridium sp.]MCM1399798.1 AzlC family ABC transporter permease [Clostridium sp.]MCM1459575.1 AzlC family ABC transporter permease [Bacteroides sp.]